MLRIIGNRIVIPKGDTGGFYLPMKPHYTEEDTVVMFTVYNPLTQQKLIEKKFSIYDGTVYIDLEYNDTKDIAAGKYIWDLKMYYKPVYDEDGNLIDASQVDSYYTAHDVPFFIVKSSTILPDIDLRKDTMARLIKQC